MSAAQPPVLRPLNIADILDLAIRLYRQNLGPFLGIVAIVYIPVGLTQIAAAYVMGTVTQTMPENPEQVPWTQFGVMGLAVLSMVLVSLLAVPLGQGALTIAVSRRYLNEPVTVADAYHSIGARWGVLIATVALVGLAVTTGTLFCILPGVWLGVLWMFAAPIIAIEGLSPIAAMKRSTALVEGEWWRCFGTYMLLSMLTGLITSAATWPLTVLSTLTLMDKNLPLAQAINQGVGVAVGIVVQPVLITGLVLLYYDLRVRKEGFDLELLAQAMGSTVALPPKLERPLYAPAPPPPVGYTSPPPPPAVAAPLPPVPAEQLPAAPPAPPTVSAEEAALLPDDLDDDFKP